MEAPAIEAGVKRRVQAVVATAELRRPPFGAVFCLVAVFSANAAVNAARMESLSRHGPCGAVGGLGGEEMAVGLLDKTASGRTLRSRNVATRPFRSERANGAALKVLVARPGFPT